ncbi:MAG: hypothetical protein RLZZ47_1500 [Bacteroidota bacterium]
MISRLKDSGLFTLVLVVLLALAIRIPDGDSASFFDQ